MLRFTLRTGLGLLLGLLGYGLLAAVGTLIPTNASFAPAPGGTTVYVSTNGFHTDVILPLGNRQDNCFAVAADPALGGRVRTYSYVSYGWGDRDFYMASYDNTFPGFTTVLDAMLVPGESLMHVTFLRNAPRPGPDVKAVSLTDAQYQRLVAFVTASFRQEGGTLAKLDQPGYGTRDFFYRAEGSYHLFRTCNAWTGDALREAGVKVSWWTPLESSVFFYLP
ncbi:MAG TPA: TIGR02117 family protein [Cytophagales bacterium]